MESGCCLVHEDTKEQKSALEVLLFHILTILSAYCTSFLGKFSAHVVQEFVSGLQIGQLQILVTAAYNNEGGIEMAKACIAARPFSRTSSTRHLTNTLVYMFEVSSYGNIVFFERTIMITQVATAK